MGQAGASMPFPSGCLVLGCASGHPAVRVGGVQLLSPGIQIPCALSEGPQHTWLTHNVNPGWLAALAQVPRGGARAGQAEARAGHSLPTCGE